MRTQLGKINSIRVGFGGYQDCCFGVSFDLGSEAWGVGDFWGDWSPSMMPRSDHAKWTEEDRKNGIADAMFKLDALLKAAKVSDVTNLVGKPIEATFDGNLLKSWRLLTEVL